MYFETKERKILFEKSEWRSQTIRSRQRLGKLRMRDHCKDHFLLNIDPGQWLSLNGRAVASDLRDVHVKSCHCQILIAFNRFEKSKKLKKKRLGVVH